VRIIERVAGDDLLRYERLALMRLIDEQHLKKPSYGVERLWRSVKYECVYINVYESALCLG